MGLALLSLVAILSVACSGAGPTPTRTPRAVADNATQTPWIIYIPVTNTPEPFTVTPLPTVTSSQPLPQPTNTRAPRPTAVAPVAPVVRATATSASSPTPAPPTNTPTPSCGETYQVTQLLGPEDGVTRDAKSGSGAGHTIQFFWAPVASYQLDPKIGYQVLITGPANRGSVIYISHNGYLQAQNANGAVLSQQATWGLTNGDDVTVQWKVSVVMSSGGFNDQSLTIIGTPTFCGPPSPTRIIYLHAIQ